MCTVPCLSIEMVTVMLTEVLAMCTVPCLPIEMVTVMLTEVLAMCTVPCLSIEMVTVMLTDWCPSHVHSAMSAHRDGNSDVD